MEDAFWQIAGDETLATLVVMARNTLYLEGSAFDNGEGGVEDVPPSPYDAVEARELNSSEADRRAAVPAAYASGIGNLLALRRKVILVYPVPEVGWDVPRVMARRYLADGAVSDLSTSMEVFERRNRATIVALDSIGDHPDLTRIRPDAILCDTFVPGRCAASVAGRPIYA